MTLRISTGLRNGLLGTSAFKTLMANGIIDIYSGSQPADADTAESGTQLVRITLASGAFVSGEAANGLEFGTPSAGVLAKAAAETWSGVILATGTAGWFRFYANTVVTGGSTTAVRFDGAISTSGQQLNLSSTSLTLSATLTIDAFTITMPAA